MSHHHSLNNIPLEVLEHIALFAATDSFLGPPTSLAPLLASSRRIHSLLSISSNHHLYALIFIEKFDISRASKRLGKEWLTPVVLAEELKRRCVFLKRIRSGIDAKIDNSSTGDVEELLFHVYLLMLENEGKNERQLRDYAAMDGWLRTFWFDSIGASKAVSDIHWEMWPHNDTTASLAMWLFWFFLKTEDFPNTERTSLTALNTLRVFALAAHKYPLTTPSWVNFLPKEGPRSTRTMTHYSQPYRLTPPPLATPAILSFLTLVNKTTQGTACAVPYTPFEASVFYKQSEDWESEWRRCLSLGNGHFDNILTESFKPGSIEGVWEGLFTYTEFTAYAALLAGAAPLTLQKSAVVRHQQTWKLREHHLLAPQIPPGIDMDIEPLPAGDPLRSYFPTGTGINESRDGIEVHQSGSRNVLRYQKASSVGAQHGDTDTPKPTVLDIIITGEGHSAWGQFNLIGRVRPCDGFISLSKEYVDGDRGKWLYRGYLVGNLNGNLAGRWRDTLSPAEVPGYEGCFAMSRRR